jgi:WD40 repeat protein
LRLNVPAHTATINVLAFSSDSQRLYTAGSDKVVRVWKKDAAWAAGGVLRWEVGPGYHGDIYGLSVAPKADLVAVAGYGNRGGMGDIVWFNASNGDYVASFFPQRRNNQLQHLQTIWSTAFSPDGRWFASSDIDGRVLLWAGDDAHRISTQNEPRALQPPLYELNAPRSEQNVGRYPIAFVGSDLLVFPTLRRNAGAKIWSLKAVALNSPDQTEPPVQRTLNGDFLHQVTALAGSGNGRYLAATMYSNPGPHRLVLYEFEQSRVRATFGLQEIQSGQEIYSLSFSGDGRFLAVGRQTADGGVVELWDITQRKKTWQSPPTRRNVVSCALSSDGRWLAYASGNGNEVSIGKIDQAGGRVDGLQRMPGAIGIDEVGFIANETSSRNATYRVFFRRDSDQRWVFDPSRNRDDRCRRLESSEKEPAVFRNVVQKWSEETIPKKVPPNFAGTLIVKDGRTEMGHITLNSRLGWPAATCWICDRRGVPIEIAIAMSPSNLIHIYAIPRQRAECRLLRMFIGHQATITSLGISPDQRYLVSGANDGAVAVWPLGGYRSGQTLFRRWGAEFSARLNGGLEFAKLDAQGPLYNRGIRPGDVLSRIEWPDAKDPQNAVHHHDRAEDIVNRLAPSSPATHLDTVSFHTTRNGVSQPLAQTPPYWHALLMLYTHEQEWIAWTPTGYFDASAGGERLIGWQFTRRLGESPLFVAAQGFWREYYQPQLIKELLATSDFSAAARTAKVASPSGVQINKIPVIRVLSPAPGDMSQQVVRIQAEITPPFKSGTLTVAPVVDDRAFDPEQLKINSAKPVIWQRDVTLDDHVHHHIAVRIDATNSTSVRIRWSPQDPNRAIDRKPVLHLLAVGNSKYSAALKYLDLDDAPGDARSIGHVFVAQAAGYYEGGVKSKVLIDESSQTIATELSKLMKPMSEGGPAGIDTVAFYFAGHGDVDADGGFCLVTKEGKSTELSSRKLLRDFCTKGRYRKLLILDACNSGAAWDDISNDWQALKRRGLRGGWPANFFAACQSDQPANDRKGGIFTSCLVTALEGAAWTTTRPLPHIDVKHVAEWLPGRVEHEITQLNLHANDTLAQRDRNGNSPYIQTPVIWTDEPTKDADHTNWEPLQLTTPREEFRRGASSRSGPSSR